MSDIKKKGITIGNYIIKLECDPEFIEDNDDGVEEYKYLFDVKNIRSLRFDDILLRVDHNDIDNAEFYFREPSYVFTTELSQRTILKALKQVVKIYRKENFKNKLTKKGKELGDLYDNL
jgi:hypothetical protein